VVRQTHIEATDVFVAAVLVKWKWGHWSIYYKCSLSFQYD